METAKPAATILRFGPYEMNPRTSEIRNRGIRVRLQEQPFQVLAVLAERPGELVTRDELRRRVWPGDTFVDFDHALNTAVKKIRAALNDDADAPRFVETVPRRGYRFIAPVTQESVRNGVNGHRAWLNPASWVQRTKWVSPPVVFAAAMGLVLAAALAVYLGGHRNHTRAARPPERVMVAVLPFQNMSSDPSQEYFSDGMTEETITQLGRLNPEHIGVIARTSVMKYKHGALSIDQIARELRAEYVLEGSIRREGTRVRINAQLIRASDQSPRWTKDFDENLGDAISLETEVAQAIAAEIASSLGEQPKMQNVTSGWVQPEAYDAYLRGRFESSMQTAKELQAGITAYQEALALDSTCAATWAGLAAAYDRGANMGMLAPRDAFPKAKKAALRAIEIDPSYPSAHVFLADVILTMDWDWNQAERQIQQALALNPNDAYAHEWYGLYFTLAGKDERAKQELERAAELDPLSTERMFTAAVVSYRSGLLDDAETKLTHALDINANHFLARELLADVYEREGKYARAVEQKSMALRLAGETAADMTLTQTYVTSGYTAAKDAALREDLVFWKGAVAKKRYASSYRIAGDYALLGDRDHAFEWLQKAFEERDIKLLCLKMDKDCEFTNIANDPRYQALVDRLNYPK
jgi:TolB-like protein/DNA-binding winged helix-turn-helix (wHTH) protein/Tfp pilus assembly protein PilF